MSRIYISAIHKSSGKTTVTIGLAAALTQRGVAVQPFKRGPDYIDPGWLSLAAGWPCQNLDFHTQSEDELLSAITPCPFALIEGNKGLHDGVDPHGTDSNAALAALLQAPVVVVIDCRGMTRGIAPTLIGHALFEPRIKLGGVILNRVAGARHERKLRQAIANYTDIAVLGALPDDSRLGIHAPYLGLVPAAEQQQAQQQLHSIAAATVEYVDLDEVIKIANTAPAIANPALGVRQTKSTPLGPSQNPTLPADAGHPRGGGRREYFPRAFLAPSLAPHASTTGDARHQPTVFRGSSLPLRLGVAYDKAFNFYYPADLHALEQAGAELIWIDMLSAEQLPERIDALLIGGGFPERHAARLSANISMRRSVSSAAQAGMPIYAECGGLMYLCRSLTSGQESYAMAGVFPLDSVMTSKPRGHGYVCLQATPFAPWSGAPPGQDELPAHEFHYSGLDPACPEPAELGIRCAYRINRGHGLGNGYDGLIMNNTLACYAHLRHTHSSPWVTQFISFVGRTKSQSM